MRKSPFRLQGLDDACEDEEFEARCNFAVGSGALYLLAPVILTDPEAVKQVTFQDKQQAQHFIQEFASLIISASCRRQETIVSHLSQKTQLP